MHGENNSDLRLELFEKFVGQKLGSELIYHPDNMGFVYFHKYQDVLIIDQLFVPVESRGRGVARETMELAYEWGRAQKCKTCIITVVFNTDTAEQALAVALHDGFKVSKMEGSVITMAKEI
jgi:predicted GNAT superfamily acetyltransferase